MARILVIDDEPSVRNYVRCVLELNGHLVREAPDGAVGLDLVRQKTPDLIFCDVFMPGVDGLEFLRKLRREGSAAKVIVMSGGGFQGMLELLPAARLLGAVAALQKPFTPQVILSAVADALPAGSVSEVEVA